MKFTTAEKRIIKRFEKKFPELIRIVTGEPYMANTHLKNTYEEKCTYEVKSFLIKEVRRARRAGFKEGDKWIQPREYKSLEEIMKPPIKNGVINGECPRCGGTSDGQIYTSNPPQKKCSICGIYWFYTVRT